MSDPASQALLRQICLAYDVRVTEQVKYEPEVGCDVWTLIAYKDKQRWMTKTRTDTAPRATLAGMVGFEVEDG